MEDKNNCPMDPFLENSQEQDEVLNSLVFFVNQYYEFQDEEQTDKVNMFAKFSKGRVIRLSGSGSRFI